MRKRTFGHACPARIQIRLRIRHLDAFWIAKDATFHHADNDDTDKTARNLKVRFYVAAKIMSMCHQTISITNQTLIND